VAACGDEKVAKNVAPAIIGGISNRKWRRGYCPAYISLAKAAGAQSRRKYGIACGESVAAERRPGVVIGGKAEAMWRSENKRLYRSRRKLKWRLAEKWLQSGWRLAAMQLGGYAAGSGCLVQRKWRAAA